MGTKQPFEKAVTEHGGTVLRVCRVLLGRHDADDAWSETFLAAMRAYPDLPETANVEAWLVTIAHRKAIDVTARPRPGPGPGRRTPRGADRPRRPGAQPTHDLWRGGPRRCPTSSARPSPTTTSPACPTPRSPQILGGTTEAARRAAADGIKTPAASTYPERSPIMNELRRPFPDTRPTTTRSTPAAPPGSTQAAEQPRACSTSPTAPSTPRSARCCWPPPTSGLVRVAYDVEDHDQVLEALAGRISPRVLRAPARLDAAARELDEYFAGAPAQLRPAAGLAAVHGVPAAGAAAPADDRLRAHRAATRQVAALAGNPRAVRAVGTACATNPLPVVVPCHRVVRTDGTRGGYVGGPAAKTTLLNLEAAA